MDKAWLNSEKELYQELRNVNKELTEYLDLENLQQQLEKSNKHTYQLSSLRWKNHSIGILTDSSFTSLGARYSQLIETL